MHSTNMSVQQYADDLITDPCEVAGVYDEGTITEAYIEGVKASTWYSRKNNFLKNAHADFTDIPFYADCLLHLQKISWQPTKI